MMGPLLRVSCTLAAAVSLTIACRYPSYAEEKPCPDEVAEQPDKPTTITEKLSERVDIVLADVEVLTQVNIVLDARAVAEVENRRARRIDVRLEDVPLREVLKVILRTVGLDFVVYDHFVYVSTPSRVTHESLESLETRVFTLKTAAGESLPKIVVQNPAVGPSPVR